MSTKAHQKYFCKFIWSKFNTYKQGVLERNFANYALFIREQQNKIICSAILNRVITNISTNSHLKTREYLPFRHICVAFTM